MSATQLNKIINIKLLAIRENNDGQLMQKIHHEFIEKVMREIKENTKLTVIYTELTPKELMSKSVNDTSEEYTGLINFRPLLYVKNANFDDVLQMYEHSSMPGFLNLIDNFDAESFETQEFINAICNEPKKIQKKKITVYFQRVEDNNTAEEVIKDVSQYLESEFGKLYKFDYIHCHQTNIAFSNDDDNVLIFNTKWYFNLSITNNPSNNARVFYLTTNYKDNDKFTKAIDLLLNPKYVNKKPFRFYYSGPNSGGSNDTIATGALQAHLTLKYSDFDMHKIIFIKLTTMKYVPEDNNIIINVVNKNRENFPLRNIETNVFYLYKDVGCDKEALDFLDYIIKNRTTKIPVETIKSTVETIKSTVVESVVESFEDKLYNDLSKLIPDINEIKQNTQTKLEEIWTHIITEISSKMYELSNLGSVNMSYKLCQDYNIESENHIILHVLRGKDNNRYTVKLEVSFDENNKKQSILHIAW